MSIDKDIRSAQKGEDSLPGWPGDGLESVLKCPICGEENRVLLFSDLIDQVCGVAPGRWNLYRCVRCESAWLDPRPTRETIHIAYSKYFTHKSMIGQQGANKNGVRMFLRACMNGYRNDKYGINRSPANSFGRWLLPFLFPLRAAIDAGYRHLSFPPIEGGCLLDIGCGNGDFLQVASEMGWAAEGFDFDHKAVEVARAMGRNVHCGNIDDLARIDRQFDIITASHVIEHVHEPAFLIKQVFRLLKPGGMLWLETPNIDSLGARKYGRYWRGLEVPRHLQLFTLKSMYSLLRSSGFENIQQKWHGLATFDLFSASELIAAFKIPDQTQPFENLSFVLFYEELYEMINKKSREYITLFASKKD